MRTDRPRPARDPGACEPRPISLMLTDAGGNKAFRCVVTLGSDGGGVTRSQWALALDSPSSPRSDPLCCGGSPRGGCSSPPLRKRFFTHSLSPSPFSTSPAPSLRYKRFWVGLSCAHQSPPKETCWGAEPNSLHPQECVSRSDQPLWDPWVSPPYPCSDADLHRTGHGSISSGTSLKSLTANKSNKSKKLIKN